MFAWVSVYWKNKITKKLQSHIAINKRAFISIVYIIYIFILISTKLPSTFLKTKNKIKQINFIFYVSVLPECTCVCIWLHAGQKSASNPLEPGLQAVVNHHESARIWSRFLQEQQVFLIAEPSLQSPPSILLNRFYCLARWKCVTLHLHLEKVLFLSIYELYIAMGLMSLAGTSIMNFWTCPYDSLSLLLIIFVTNLKSIFFFIYF